MKARLSSQCPLLAATMVSLIVNTSCFLDRSGTGTPPPARTDWEVSLTPQRYCISDPMVLSWDVGEPVGCAAGEASCTSVEITDTVGSFGTWPETAASGSERFDSNQSPHAFSVAVTHNHQPSFYTWQTKTVRAEAIPVGGETENSRFGARCDGEMWSISAFEYRFWLDEFGGCVHVREICNFENDTVLINSTAAGAGRLRLERGSCADIDWPTTDLIIFAGLETPPPTLVLLRCTERGTTPPDPQPAINLSMHFDCDASRPECMNG